jgi:hypothetical protein
LVEARLEGEDNHLTNLFWMKPLQIKLWQKFQNVAINDNMSRASLYILLDVIFWKCKIPLMYIFSFMIKNNKYKYGYKDEKKCQKGILIHDEPELYNAIIANQIHTCNEKCQGPAPPGHTCKKGFPQPFNKTTYVRKFTIKKKVM